MGLIVQLVYETKNVCISKLVCFFAFQATKLCWVSATAPGGEVKYIFVLLLSFSCIYSKYCNSCALVLVIDMQTLFFSNSQGVGMGGRKFWENCVLWFSYTRFCFHKYTKMQWKSLVLMGLFQFCVELYLMSVSMSFSRHHWQKIFM